MVFITTPPRRQRQSVPWRGHLLPSPPRRPRPSVHDLPCEASRSAKMGEGRSDRNLYAHGGAARRRNQGGDRGANPGDLLSKYEISHEKRKYLGPVTLPCEFVKGRATQRSEFTTLQLRLVWEIFRRRERSTLGS